MTPVEALEAIHGYAAANRIETRTHARDRMRQRGATDNDVRHALMTAAVCTLRRPEPGKSLMNERWRVEGRKVERAEEEKDMKRCVECGGRLEAADTEEEISIGEARIVAVVPARRCVDCGSAYVASELGQRLDLFVASRLLELGIAGGEAFRFMRKALGLRAADVGELLNVDPVTISRWETGKVPVDRGALAALAAAASEKLEGKTATLDRLRALGSPARPRRTYRLDFAQAS